MSLKTIGLDSDLASYVVRYGTREATVLARLRAETARMSEARMQIAPEQGAFMQMLVRLLGASRCIEVGVFTGYSSTAVALALPEDGHILACDINRQWTAMARRYWQEADVESKISLRLAPANETLDALLDDGQASSYDFAFIDADKESYEGYYERCLALLRPGGLITIDNVLWSGSVADPNNDDATTQVLRAFNERRHVDERVEISLVPIGDGLTLLRKI